MFSQFNAIPRALSRGWLGHDVLRQFTAEVGLGAATGARMTPANDNGTCDFDVGQRLREEEQRYFCPGA